LTDRTKHRDVDPLTPQLIAALPVAVLSEASKVWVA
jgi:hypothetical protein